MTAASSFAVPELPRFFAAAALLFVLGSPSPSFPGSHRSAGDGEREVSRQGRVVLLHGLGRSSRSMGKIERKLSDSGYAVFNLDYPSRKRTIDELADLLHEFLLECCLSKGGSIHFVTHSLGGIVVRRYIRKSRPPNLGRVVMLSPPNGGSGIIDSLGKLPLFRFVMGPAAMELGTGPSSVPGSLGPADFELGIITGRRSVNPIGSLLVDGEDDGSVSVESAKLEGMKSFLVVPASHTFIMRNRRVIDEILHFLEEGRFTSPAEPVGE